MKHEIKEFNASQIKEIRLWEDYFDLSRPTSVEAREVSTFFTKTSPQNDDDKTKKVHDTNSTIPKVEEEINDEEMFNEIHKSPPQLKFKWKVPPWKRKADNLIEPKEVEDKDQMTRLWI